MQAVFVVAAVAVVCAFWLVGMASYLTIARAAGLRFPAGLEPVRVYRHALGRMRGSPETRRMLVGFGGVLVLAPFLFELMARMRGG